MTIEQKAAQTADSILKVLASYDLSKDERKKLSHLVYDLLVASVEESARHHNEATVVCCGPEADLAHKIQEEVNRKKDLLISNLMALR